LKDVNRHALVITAKPAFFALLSRLSGDTFEVPDATENDTSRVYLISGDFLYHEEALEWVEENRQAFFEDTFIAWYAEENKCPQDISWGDFQDYFVFSIQSMIIDAATNEELYQDYEKE
jgi:hypothetical protein